MLMLEILTGILLDIDFCLSKIYKFKIIITLKCLLWKSLNWSDVQMGKQKTSWRECLEVR